MVEVAPYWNVNEIDYLTYLYYIIVEVAPYWNVNTEKPTDGEYLWIS